MSTEIKRTPNARQSSKENNRYTNTNEDKNPYCDPTLKKDGRLPLTLQEEEAFVATYKIVKQIWLDYGSAKSKILTTH